MIKYSLSSPPETPPDSGIWGNNVLISFRKAVHVVPTPFLVRVNCSVTIVAAQSLQLGEVPDNFHFYLALFLRSCFYCNYCCSVFPLFFLHNGRFSISQKCDVTVQNFEHSKHQNILTFTVCLIVQITLLIR